MEGGKGGWESAQGTVSISVPPQVAPDTRIWVYIVYSGGDPRRPGDDVWC